MKKDSIIAQQQLYLSYLPLVRKQFGDIPGIGMIGLGAKERGGKSYDEWAFRFYVHTKQPLGSIPEQQRIPPTIFGVQTDVILHFETESLICDASIVNEDITDYRTQGIRGGISIRNQHFDNDQPSGYGTLGVLATRTSDNALVALTCAHVVSAALQDPNTINTRIGHPKYWTTCCGCPHGYIGDVAKATLNADLDCAIIAIHDDVKEYVTDNHTETTIQEIPGAVTGAAAMVCFDPVKKRGRNTRLSEGRVKEIAWGNNQMLIERLDAHAGAPFACHGDSGAVVLNSSGRVVGLLVAASRDNRKWAIVTHIKPVMVELGISIAGTVATSLGDPIGGGPTGCELLIWPGGQADTSFNPAEEFSSSDFQFTGPVDWDVTTGRITALIIEKDGAPITPTGTVTGAITIKVRYDNSSPSRDSNDTVWIKAHGTEDRTKFRTIFSITGRVNTSAPLDGDDHKSFDASGGTNNQPEVAIPGTNGATRFLAKAEIIYEILPHDITWDEFGANHFVTGDPPGIKGNIIARREIKYGSGKQTLVDVSRLHEDKVNWESAGPSTGNDFQWPNNPIPNKCFRLANEGFRFSTDPAFNTDPVNLRQAYLRADYRDFLEFNNGTPGTWIRITPFVEWFANLSHQAAAGAVNNIGAGADAEKIPNQQPVIAAIATQEARFSETNVTLTAVPADADNDVLTTVVWAQTSPAPIIALVANPALPITSVRFTAPAASRQLIFSATTRDSTEGLSRAPAVPPAPAVPNFQSIPAVAIVNVVEWLFRVGGYADRVDNQTEVFTSAQFGFAGNVDWDVATGGTQAIILETGGTAAAALDTITVRYDNVSADQTRANTVIVQATQGANSFFKRRTVLLALWGAWPGGQVDTALNATEDFNAADMGFAAGTVLNWNVGDGAADGVIIGPGGTTSNGVAAITVRYDTRSASIIATNSVWIKATNPANGQVSIILRTVFRVVPRVVNTAAALHPDNALNYGVGNGVATDAGVVDPTMAGVTRLTAKQEQIYDITPISIPWNRRLVSFVFDDGASLPQITNTKFECRASRQRLFVALTAPPGGNRVVTVVNVTPGNDAAFINDGSADNGDCQYPTNALPNNIFRIDSPGANPTVFDRLTLRFDLREFVQFHNGNGWVRITPFSEWFTNLTWIAGAPVAPNNSGAGLGAVAVDNTPPVINAGADQAVGTGSNVIMAAAFADGEADTRNGNFTWVQIAGTPVVLGGAAPLATVNFTAPGVPGRLTFRVSADDSTVILNSHNPGNSNGSDTINIDVN